MLKNYLKIAFKGLIRKKYYTFISLFGIVVTLVVLTISVALMNQMATLGRPGSRLSRCLIVDRLESEFKRGNIISKPSYYMLDRYVRNLKGPEAVSIFSDAHEVIIYSASTRVPLKVRYTDDVFWEIAELPFIGGASYGKESVDKADMVTVITDRAEKQIFGVKPALGEYLETSKGTYRIIGIIPYKEITAPTLNADIYVPITTASGKMNNRELWGAESALVQAANRSQFASIKSEFQNHMDQLIKDFKDEKQLRSFDCFIGTMSESMANMVNQSETAYFAGIVGLILLFMLLPAINLTTINISRIMERYPEIGIRKAFGASSSALMGQFIIENIILTLIGGVLAYLLSGIILILINGSGVVPWGYIRLDTTVFFYCMVVTIFFGVFSGALPSYRMSRLHPAEALKGISR
ncbi:conserved membrane hypothetical protein [Candidatus Zixiibacteriota bacterium]|nr:conserved membrane hypothetical protein [candidate division Zixibacteria bacterium]